MTQAKIIANRLVGEVCSLIIGWVAFYYITIWLNPNASEITKQTMVLQFLCVIAFSKIFTFTYNKLRLKFKKN